MNAPYSGAKSPAPPFAGEKSRPARASRHVWRRRSLTAHAYGCALMDGTHVAHPLKTAPVGSERHRDYLYADLVDTTLDFERRAQRAGVAELVDARDLKSLGPQGLCGFDSRPPHQSIK